MQMTTLTFLTMQLPDASTASAVNETCSMMQWYNWVMLVVRSNASSSVSDSWWHGLQWQQIYRLSAVLRVLAQNKFFNLFNYEVDWPRTLSSYIAYRSITALTVTLTLLTLPLHNSAECTRLLYAITEVIHDGMRMHVTWNFQSGQFLTTREVAWYIIKSCPTSVCVYVCQTINFEILYIGSSNMHSCIFREYDVTAIFVRWPEVTTRN